MKFVKLKNVKKSRPVALFCALLLTFQAGIISASAATASTKVEECDHEWVYDLRFEIDQAITETKQVCNTCGGWFDTGEDVSNHSLIAHDSAGRWHSSKVHTATTHYTAYAYGVEGLFEDDDYTDDWVGTQFDDNGNLIRIALLNPSTQEKARVYF